MTGIERLKILSHESKIKGLLKVIAYLETRPDMDEKYLNEEKTPEQMWEYIKKKAKEQAINGCAAIDDDVVYVWAISYFLATNEALGLNKTNSSTPSTTKSKTKKEDKNTDNKEEQKEGKEQDNKNQSQISIFQEGN